MNETKAGGTACGAGWFDIAAPTPDKTFDAELIERFDNDYRYLADTIRDWLDDLAHNDLELFNVAVHRVTSYVAESFEIAKSIHGKPEDDQGDN